MVRKMEKIMTIWQHLRSDNNCLVIGGTNPDLDHLNTDDLYKMITPSIVVKKRDGTQKKIEILDTTITSSVREKKNIFMLLPEDINEDEVEIGSIVFTSK